MKDLYSAIYRFRGADRQRCADYIYANWLSVILWQINVTALKMWRIAKCVSDKKVDTDDDRSTSNRTPLSVRESIATIQLGICVSWICCSRSLSSQRCWQKQARERSCAGVENAGSDSVKLYLRDKRTKWHSRLLQQRLQSVQNSAPRVIFRIRRSEHITPLLISLHCLRVAERIYVKLAVMTYRPIHGTSPSYLQSRFTRVSDMTSRRRMRSSTSHRLDVPPVRLSTIRRRAFLVSCATVWNDLPLHVASAPSLAFFRQRLKTFLFSRFYQDTIIWLVCYYTIHH